MRASRTISQIQKNIYPKCNIKKQHQKQSLNLVCLTSNCKFRGPLCALCKKQHNGHNVVPLKTFIGNIQTILKKTTFLQTISEGQQKIQQKNIQQKNFNKLQQSFFEVMGMLKLQVLELSEHIKKTQDKLIQQFQQIKLSFSNQVSKNEIIKENLEYFKQKQITDSLQLRKNIGSLLKVINCNKNEIFIECEVDQLINTYIAKVQLYKQNIYNMQSDLKQMFQSIHEKASIQKIKSNRPKTALPTTGSTMNKNLIFSSVFKPVSIILQKDGSISKLKDNQGDKIVFVNNCVSTKNNQICFKILELKGVICVGIGLKDKVKQKTFKFQKNNLGHGVYVIASNSLKYSHTDKGQNNVNSQLNLVTGDEISLNLDQKGKKIIFKYKNDEKKTLQLNLKTLPDNLWKQLEFCVILSSQGDKIQII